MDKTHIVSLRGHYTSETEDIILQFIVKTVNGSADISQMALTWLLATYYGHERLVCGL